MILHKMGLAVKGKFSWNQNKVDRAKDVATLMQAVIAFFALILAGTWFVMERNLEPKITISHELTYRGLDSSWKWIHLAVTIKNVSDRQVFVDEGQVVIQRILPLDPSINERIKDRINLVWDGEMEVKWPIIGEPLASNKGLNLEPGEFDKLYFEFQLPSKIKTIKVQSMFLLGDERKWNHQSIHDVFKSEE